MNRTIRDQVLSRPLTPPRPFPHLTLEEVEAAQRQPASSASIQAALRLHRDDPQFLAHCEELITVFKRGMDDLAALLRAFDQTQQAVYAAQQSGDRRLAIALAKSFARQPAVAPRP